MKYFLITILLLILSNCLFAKSYSLQVYLDKVLDIDEGVKNSRIMIRQSELDYYSARNLYKLNLTLAPEYKRSDLKNMTYGRTFNTYNKNLSTTLFQEFYTGTKVSISSGMDLEKNISAKNKKSYSFGFNLEQDLYRNYFGYANKIREVIAHNSYKESKIESEIAVIDKCKEGVLNFSKSYISMKKLTVYKELKKEAKQVWNRTQKNYKRKLINKLSYLSAKSDWISIQETVESYKSLYKSNKLTIDSYINDNDYKLNNPFPTLFQIEIPNKSYKTGHSYKKMNLKVLNYNQNYKLAKDRNRANIKFTLSGNKQKVRDSVNESLIREDIDSTVIKAGIQIDFSLYNKGKDSDLEKAYLNKGIAQNELSQYERNVSNRVKELKISLEKIKSSLKFSKEKMTVYKGQRKEALRNMLSGHIEFKDYISYRDRLHLEKINSMDLELTYTRNLLELLKLLGVYPNICRAE